MLFVLSKESRDLLEKTRTNKLFVTIYGTRRFLAAFIKTVTGTYLEPDESNSHP